jgi:hypothetical protein
MAVLYANEELGEDLVAHENTVAQVFFLRRTFQPSIYQLCGICFEDTARRTRGCQCEAIKPIMFMVFIGPKFAHNIQNIRWSHFRWFFPWVVCVHCFTLNSYNLYKKKCSCKSQLRKCNKHRILYCTRVVKIMYIRIDVTRAIISIYMQEKGIVLYCTRVIRCMYTH